MLWGEKLNQTVALSEQVTWTTNQKRVRPQRLRVTFESSTLKSLDTLILKKLCLLKAYCLLKDIRAPNVKSHFSIDFLKQSDIFAALVLTKCFVWVEKWTFQVSVSRQLSTCCLRYGTQDSAAKIKISVLRIAVFKSQPIRWLVHPEQYIYF